MSTLSLHGDEWNGILNGEWNIEGPSWSDVEKAIRRLDAKTYTIVTIQGSGEQHLAVGGGSGRYVVYATFDNEEFWNLLGATTVSGTVLLNAGGQEGDCPAAQIVELESALSAARAFLVDRRLEPGLQWEKQ